MSRSKHSLLVGQSLLSSFEIISMKNIGVLDYAGCHQPNDPLQVTVAPFRYPPPAFMFAGLVNSRVQSRHSNDFTGTFKLIDVATHLHKKIGGSFVSDAFYMEVIMFISSSISLRAISISMSVIS